VPRERYSFTMSFWVVPESAEAATSCRSATATYRANSHAAVALIVMEVFMRSRGIPSKSVCMSST
jgi:hypothetical protein